MRKWVELLLGILDSGVLSLNMKKTLGGRRLAMLTGVFAAKLLAAFSVVLCPVECAALRKLCCLRFFCKYSLQNN